MEHAAIAGPAVRSRFSPELLFAWIAGIAGIVLVVLIAPVAGGNEKLNFQRAAGLASGYVLVGPATVPGGIAELIRATAERYPEGAAPPYHYTQAEFDRLASLRLDEAHPQTLRPNPIAVLHPVSYLPQVPTIAAGEALGLSPLLLFYLARLAGLAAGIVLTFFAIRIIPAHKHLLAAVALLPPMTFSRSTLDADQFTNGLAFLFLAMVIREVTADGPIRTRVLAGMAIAAFILAQSKSAYLLLPLFALAIPQARFGSLKRKLAWCALIALPGVLGSLAWMIVLKASYFDALVYKTWSGVVRPADQFHFVLTNPIAFGETILRTVFATPFIPRAIVGAIGVFGPPVMIPVLFLALIGMLLAAVGMSDSAEIAVPRRAKLLAAVLTLATLLIILTLLYLQWTRFGAPVIDGFSGRYLYPVVPLLLVLLPAGGRRWLPAGAMLALFGVVTTGVTWFVTWQTYWA